MASFTFTISLQEIPIKHDLSLKQPAPHDAPPTFQVLGLPSGALAHLMSLLPLVFFLQGYFILPCYSYPPFHLVFKYANDLKHLKF